MPAAALEWLSSNLALADMSDAELAERRISRRIVAALPLPDGRLSAMDPLTQPDRPALTRQVKPGRYPVEVLISDDESRIAVAIIRFRAGKTGTWEMAVIPGQSLAKLKKGEFFGIPVDAGTAAFASSGFGAAVAERERIEKRKTSGYISYFDNVLESDLAGSTPAFLHEPIKERPEAAAVIMESGWGDGHYPVLFGLGSDREPVLALIDFDVIKNADGRTELGNRKQAALAMLTAEARAASDQAYAALKQDDIEALRALLKANAVTPNTYVPTELATLLWVAIRLDKPRAVALFLEHGARDAVPDLVIFRAANTRYSTYARWLDEQAKLPRKTTEPPLARRSPELLALMEELSRRP